ncbi:MAG: 23S rRNA (uracil(1939)-C(5))-methyltransferase RlmD [Bacteroidales bacterium]|nr:23S rRNA (uracil(1939)-C(5))-methyltransferase RlmD [Bacteroidales bacterium]
MGRKKLPVYTDVTIEDIASEGKSLARIDDLVIFVKGPVPGDVVDLQVKRKRKNYQEAVVMRYVRYSEKRIDPFCEHFGLCGGCKWQHLPYDKQLIYKEKQVLNAIQRIGKTAVERIEPILGCDQTTFYRNKLEYTFSNHRWLTKDETQIQKDIANRNGLGFHVPGRYDRIVDIQKCHLQEDPSNEIRNTIKEYAFSENLSFYDHNTNGGLLRNLIIRTSTTGETMVILSVQYDQPEVYELLRHIYERFPALTSLLYVINPKRNETLYDQDIKVFEGRDHIIEKLDGLKFKIGPKSFFQTNTRQAERLYQKARVLAGLKGKEIVYDLYTGTGTIANFLAPSAAMVVGIESVPEAIEDARENASLNNISNTAFYTGDMKDIFTPELVSKHGRPDVIVTDPPRAGMHQKVIENILDIAPPRIVYISCNPSTQARDVALMTEKYKITVSQAVDMFPHTHHIENILLLDKKD